MCAWIFVCFPPVQCWNYVQWTLKYDWCSRMMIVFDRWALFGGNDKERKRKRKREKTRRKESQVANIHRRLNSMGAHSGGYLAEISIMWDRIRLSMTLGMALWIDWNQNGLWPGRWFWVIFRQWLSLCPYIETAFQYRFSKSIYFKENSRTIAMRSSRRPQWSNLTSVQTATQRSQINRFYWKNNFD